MAVVVVLNISNTKGALSKLTFGGDKVNSWDDKAPEPAVLEVGMAEADLSNKGLKAGGAIIVGAWISHKDNGALTSLDISDNHIPNDQQANLKRICERKNIDLQL